jgi:actin related protein 2/3 complex, subunit 4
MSASKEPFFLCVAQTLRAALCILPYPSTSAEGDAVPEVEDDALTLDSSDASRLTSSMQAVSPMRCNPLHLRWTQGDECVIEATHNSTRVSFWFAAAHQPGDARTPQLLQQYIRFFSTHGAATAVLPVLRCAPRRREAAPHQVRRGEEQTYDVSFLVLPQHVATYGRDHVVAFIVAFVKSVEADVAGLKVALDERRHAAARAFFS